MSKTLAQACTTSSAGFTAHNAFVYPTKTIWATPGGNGATTAFESTLK